MSDERLYRVHHRMSRFRGRIVRLVIRHTKAMAIKNVLAECVDDGERFVCPFRGLRRVRKP